MTSIINSEAFDHGLKPRNETGVLLLADYIPNKSVGGHINHVPTNTLFLRALIPHHANKLFAPDSMAFTFILNCPGTYNITIGPDARANEAIRPNFSIDEFENYKTELMRLFELVNPDLPFLVRPGENTITCLAQQIQLGIGRCPSINSDLVLQHAERMVERIVHLIVLKRQSHLSSFLFAQILEMELLELIGRLVCRPVHQQQVIHIACRYFRAVMEKLGE